jgi:phospholipid/cholesterol/gamma-HCH transport system substrate-binding protein
MARTKAAVVIGVLVAMGGALVVMRSLESKYIEIRAYTDDAGGLDEGTSVRLNGISIGDLDRLNLTTSRDPKRKIEFIMKVNRRFLHEIPRDSLVGVAATNLLGNYYIDIVQGRDPQPVAPGGELQTTASSDPDKLLAQMSNEFQAIQGILDRADKLLAGVAAGQGNVGMWAKQGMTKLNGSSAELNKLTDDIKNGHGNLSKVDDLSKQMDAPQKRWNDLMAGIQGGQGTAGKMQALSAEVQQMTKEANDLTSALNSEQGPGPRLTKLQARFSDLQEKLQSSLNRIASGQGTLGQLNVNPQLSSAIQNTSTEFQALTRDLRANPRKFLSFTVKFF